MSRAAKPGLGRSPAADSVSLKVSLRGAKPPIWRRVLLPASMTLDHLHRVIQCVMPWYDSHLHGFDVQGRQFGDPTLLDDAEDEKQMTLAALLAGRVAKFSYTYDYGDDWEHEILIEKPPVEKPPVEKPPGAPGLGALPRCLGGKRAAPPEDCGGIYGYLELLDILANPTHPERAERMEWIGGEIDPAQFDLDAANHRLAQAFRKR